MTETIMAYLTERRMSSLGNVAMHFDCSVSEIIPIIQTLESEDRLRMAQPRCRGACDSCESCKTEPVVATLTEGCILISLDKKEERL